nr:MAG TPA: hypothetical protein [Bacteriophage sp.]
MIFLSKYSDYCILSIYYYITRRIYLLHPYGHLLRMQAFR